MKTSWSASGQPTTASGRPASTGSAKSPAPMCSTASRVRSQARAPSARRDRAPARVGVDDPDASRHAARRRACDPARLPDRGLAGGERGRASGRPCRRRRPRAARRRERYAIRVSVCVPPQRGKRHVRAARATSARRRPGSARRARSRATRRRTGRTATTTPRGSCRAAASSRPASTTQAPASEVTSSRPGAGSEKSAGCAFSTPTTSRIVVEHRAAGRAEQPRRATDDARARRRDRLPRSARRLRLALCERRAHDRPRALARLVLVRDLDPLELALLTRVSFERVEAAAQARVDGPARQAEQLGDLAGRVLEQVAKHDHGAVLRRQRGERGEQRPSSGAGRSGRRDASTQLGLGAQLPRPRPVDRAVDDDPVQPRPERPAAVEAVEVADRRRERPPARCPRRRRRRGRRGTRRGTRAASAAGRAPRSPRRTLAAPRARRRARRGRRPSADCTAAAVARGPCSRDHDEAGVVGGTRDARLLDRGAASAERAERPPRERRREDQAEALVDVVRADGHRSRAQAAAHRARARAGWRRHRS